MARGNDYTTCICTRCFKLPLPLHRIKNDTAKKHHKRYGPGKLLGAEPRVTAAQMALNDGGGGRKMMMVMMVHGTLADGNAR